MKAESKNDGDQSEKEIPWVGCADQNNPLLFRQTAGGLMVCVVCALRAFPRGLSTA